MSTRRFKLLWRALPRGGRREIILLAALGRRAPDPETAWFVTEFVGAGREDEAPTGSSAPKTLASLTLFSLRAVHSIRSASWSALTMFDHELHGRP